MKCDHGISVIELLTVIAILAVLAFFTMPQIDSWMGKRKFRNGFEQLYNSLTILKGEAFGKNTTMRAELKKSNDGYIILSYQSQSDTITPDCSASGPWKNLPEQQLRIGNAIISSPPNICFYRDGTAEPAEYTLESTKYGQYKIAVHSATGFMERLKKNKKTNTWDEP